ncbi:Mu transposase C-terminal domain-containing protein [Mucilaginibacter sp. SG564]|uniref:Mu transposase C-terminal domain-containing protein n=1 Tax=Mucilaginibacter sp. SG564 TaxID=2587022 RepID=UPI001556BD9A|nr:Mu transposase C-terminal domain-containing protein [Mucilaginibacter sp. SG564]NOW94768.1 putative transposase [Mucilaginibacter sp. SG564]
MNTLELKPGAIVIYLAEKYMVQRVIDLKVVLLRHLEKSAVYIRAEINHLEVLKSESRDYFEAVENISDERWEAAQKRYNIIEPIINTSTNRSSLVKHIAATHSIHPATLYRWLNQFEQIGTISALAPKRKHGGKGISRLSLGQDIILNSFLEEMYLTRKRFSIKKAYLEIAAACKSQSLEVPHINTFRKRLSSISEEEVTKKRYGKKLASEKFSPIGGSVPGADYPLSIIQIDHTKVDLELVDETSRKPMGRPWITVALDVYSRMIVGIYLSYDPPGTIGVGMCLYNAILSKEIYLNKLEVEGEWPYWGIMKRIHVDNAKEFHGKTLAKACNEYNIKLEWRPVKQPNFGGHIERLMGTCMNNVHDLPGTTFSNPAEKSNYDSVTNAIFSIKEFEKWLVYYIVNIYHKTLHKGISTTPLAKFKEGILGTDVKPGVGLPPKVFNERKLKLDFLPTSERTIQRYGIKIDHITYYSDILRNRIHATEATGTRTRIKKKFIVKRDPRDISLIYFYDPNLHEYFEIPYRNIAHPAITIWEYREAVKRLEAEGRKHIDEDAIFFAYEALREIELSSKSKTTRAKRIKKESKAVLSIERSSNRAAQSSEIADTDEKPLSSIFDDKEIKPFDDI